MALEIRHTHDGRVLISKGNIHQPPIGFEVNFYPRVNIIQVATANKALPEKRMNAIGDRMQFSFGGYNITIEKMNDHGFLDKKIISLKDRIGKVKEIDNGG